MDQCQNFTTVSEPVSREDSPTKENALKRAEMFLESCHTAVTNNDNIIDILNKVANKSYSGVIDNGTNCEILTKIKLKDYLRFDAKKARNATTNDKAKSTIEEEKKVLLTDIPEELTNDQLLEIYEEKLREHMKQLSIMEKNGVKDLESSGVLEEQRNPPDKQSDVASKAEKLINNSDNHSFWQKLCKFHNQRGSFKKPRRKKGNLRKSFSETDMSDEDPRQDTKILGDMCSSGSNRDTVNEDGDRFPNDDRTNRAITDVPDVVVIGSGSIVPKDLCSMKTLTSRIQTAPSRAIYETTYI